MDKTTIIITASHLSTSLSCSPASNTKHPVINVNNDSSHGGKKRSPESLDLTHLLFTEAAARSVPRFPPYHPRRRVGYVLSNRFRYQTHGSLLFISCFAQSVCFAHIRRQGQERQRFQRGAHHRDLSPAPTASALLGNRAGYASALNSPSNHRQNPNLESMK